MGSEKKAITRRDFVRGTVYSTLGASVLGMPWQEASAKSGGTSLVTIVRDRGAMNSSRYVDLKTVETMLKQTLLQFTGRGNTKDAWRSLIKANDVVGLVPTEHLNPTHDEVVEAVTKSLRSAGIPKRQIQEVQGWSGDPKNCSALIALPALKAHQQTGIGTVLKNYIMFSGEPDRYHRSGSSKLGEIWNLPSVRGKTKLVLVDALYPLCDKGPQPDPRYKWSYNGLIAGSDPVAVETVSVKIIMEKRQALRGEYWPLSPPPVCVEAADRVYGLGTSKLKNIRIRKSGWMQDSLV